MRVELAPAGLIWSSFSAGSMSFCLFVCMGRGAEEYKKEKAKQKNARK